MCPKRGGSKKIFIRERQTNGVTLVWSRYSTFYFIKKGKYLHNIGIFHTHIRNSNKAVWTPNHHSVTTESNRKLHNNTHLKTQQFIQLSFFLRAAFITPLPLCLESLLFLLWNKLLDIDDVSISHICQKYWCNQHMSIRNLKNPIYEHKCKVVHF